MPKVLKVILVIFLVALIGILSVSYLTNHNQNFLEDITKNIQENYSLTEDITYTNQYGNYYIITTPTQVIVLTKEYTEVLKENISILTKNNENLPLIYKTNTLMYEKTKLIKGNLSYEYYDARTGELLKTTTMEQQ